MMWLRLIVLLAGSVLATCSEPLPNAGFTCPCIEGWECVGDVCMKKCQTSAGCATNERCGQENYCEPYEADVTTGDASIFLKPPEIMGEHEDNTGEGLQTDIVATLADVDVQAPEGFLQFCITDSECAAYGLTCFEAGGSDTSAVCTMKCETDADCPGTTICKEQGDEYVCLRAEYCDECASDLQCGGDLNCVEANDGQGFCSSACQLDNQDSCLPGDICRQVDSMLDSYCFPLFGACKGDGTHCTPCQHDEHCLKGHVCHENPNTHEKYCGKVCQVKMDCPKGFGCYELAGERYSLCTLEIDAEPVETCYKGNKGFCEPCMKNYECQSDTCYNYPAENKYFCTFPCDNDEWPVEGCPPGLFCVPNYGESGGSVCGPPTAWGCQGFLNCMGVDCPMDETCLGGFCQPT